MDIEEHYSQLLGIHSSWQITHVNLKMQEQRVDIEIEYADDEGPCSECGAISPKHDDRKRRSWLPPGYDAVCYLPTLRVTEGSL